jgi:SlyX protein
MENRLIDLEIRYTHLERQLNELNQVVFDQQKTIDRLAKDVSGLRARLASAEDDAPDEPPPHY